MKVSFQIYFDHDDFEAFSKVLQFNEVHGQFLRDGVVIRLEKVFYRMARRDLKPNEALPLVLSANAVSTLAYLVSSYSPDCVSLKHEVKERCFDVLCSVFFDLQ